MFKFLKDKLKKAVSTFSTQAEEISKKEVNKVIEEGKIEKEVVTEKSEETKVKEEINEKPVEKKKEVVKEIKAEKKEGFFKKITKAVTTKKLSETQFEKLFENIEITLLENNVAVEVINKLKDDLKTSLVNQAIARKNIEQTITKTLHNSIEELFNYHNIDLLKKIQEKKPYIICFVGINGSGKTTTIAKLTQLFKDNKKTVVLAAADTFRAAAIDQLQHHADKLNVKLIKHDYGSDPAAVAYDAVKHAQATNKDIVLIDTAGRLHSNVNLMQEVQKIIKVAQPDLTLFVGESITGNDCVTQAKTFKKKIGIDGIILSKADIDEKGGTAISISYVTSRPILYLGTGQEYTDLQKFEPKLVLEGLGL
jgi:fused signal recognition particle receptor